MVMLDTPEEMTAEGREAFVGDGQDAGMVVMVVVVVTEAMVVVQAVVLWY